jgi:hypothetical protein
MLQKYLSQLIEEIQLPPLEPQNANGFFSLSFKDDLTLFLRDLSPGFIITANIATLPEKEREDLFIYLMKANFMGQGTADQIFGVDPNEKFLTLSRTISYEVNYADFKEILETFVNYLAYWKNEIQNKQRTKQ